VYPVKLTFKKPPKNVKSPLPAEILNDGEFVSVCPAE